MRGLSAPSGLPRAGPASWGSATRVAGGLGGGSGWAPKGPRLLTCFTLLHRNTRANPSRLLAGDPNAQVRPSLGVRYVAGRSSLRALCQLAHAVHGPRPSPGVRAIPSLPALFPPPGHQHATTAQHLFSPGGRVGAEES